MTAFSVSSNMLTFRLSNICKPEYNLRYITCVSFLYIRSHVSFHLSIILWNMIIKPLIASSDSIFSIFSCFWFIILSIFSMSFISRKLSSIFILSVYFYGFFWRKVAYHPHRFTESFIPFSCIPFS